LAKRTNYQGEKRSKELNRLKKQNDKKERKKNNDNDEVLDIDLPQPEEQLPPFDDTK